MGITLFFDLTYVTVYTFIIIIFMFIFIFLIFIFIMNASLFVHRKMCSESKSRKCNNKNQCVCWNCNKLCTAHSQERKHTMHDFNWNMYM